MDVAHIASLFKRYTESFPQEEMIQLKIHHTERVVADAIEIMHREHFSKDLQTAGAIAAWLHDVGRFPQFMKYRTFSDRNSEMVRRRLPAHAGHQDVSRGAHYVDRQQRGGHD